MTDITDEQAAEMAGIYRRATGLAEHATVDEFMLRLQAMIAAARVVVLRPLPIESAPKSDETDILASSAGLVWFQCCWDPDDECYMTFNCYLERDERLAKIGRNRFEPKYWMPLPLPPTTDGEFQ